jgi:carbonic anhydrase
MHDHGPAPPADRLSRRLLIAGAASMLGAPRAFAKARPAGEPALTPGAALQRLMAGNARFVAGKSIHPHADSVRRHSVSGAQHPFATILTCADSRVGPEVIFDRGLGDLFVVRNAGNVVDDVAMASIEYSVIHLGSTVVMVLGHQHCGAVSATVDALSGKANAEDKDTKIAALANAIAPAIKSVPASAPDKVEAGVMANARLGAHLLLTTSPPLGAHVRDGRLKIVSAHYSLDDGRVSQVLDAQA